MEPLHPKVKVPAVVGTVITVILAVLAGLNTVPEVAAYAAAGTTILNTISGYFTFPE